MTRFLPLLARYEQGLVKHVPGLSGAFEEELLSFPVGEHDDLVDALSYAFAASAPTADYYPPALQRPTPVRQGRF